MNIDYTKKTFTQDEKNIMYAETERLRETRPNHIPILIQLNSNVLSIDKYKILTNIDLNIQEVINNTLKKKLINLQPTDNLIISIIKLSGKEKEKIFQETKNIPIKEFYDNNKDPETNFLILKVTRQTTYKWLKSIASYLF